ncbi:MAG: hypothetical protein H6809_04395 [Phycisphaeraceae bacterium]|nr:hypothetical protein [Phycisphaeraceae bacterium]
MIAGKHIVGVGIGAVLMPAAALAQPSALVVTTLTDPATGAPIAEVAPGQTVRMRTTVSWEPGGTQFAGIAGDMLVAPLTPGGGEGTPSNLVSEFSIGALVSLGTFSGDDLLGIDINVTPPFFPAGGPVPPSLNYWGIQFIGYDWAAPAEPGVYEFRFEPVLFFPNVRIYPSQSSPQFVSVPTTYAAASVTVIPAPAAASCVALAAAIAPRRRRPGIVAG